MAIKYTIKVKPYDKVIHKSVDEGNVEIFHGRKYIVITSTSDYRDRHFRFNEISATIEVVARKAVESILEREAMIPLKVTVSSSIHTNRHKKK